MTIEVKSPDVNNPGDVMSAVAELKSAVETGDKAREDKINNFLEKQETKSAEVAKELAARKAFEADLTEKMDGIEKSLYRSSNAISEYKEDKKSLEHVESFMRKGKDYLDEIKELELKYLRTDDKVEGGYLVPIEYDNEIIKNITEISPIRSLARVKTIGTNRLAAPKRASLISSYWVGEGETITTSNSTYAEEVIPTEKLATICIITNEELADSAFNMESEINADVSESFAKKEGTSFLTGTGIKQPEGIINNADIAVINSGLATAMDFNLLNDLYGELKTGYNAAYGMNRKTIAYVRGLTDGVGQPLWQAGNLAAGIPNTIYGDPYYEMPDLADVGAGAKPVIYGDFRAGYTIVDRLGMRILRDEYTLAGEDKVRFVFTKRVGGQVVKPEAIKIGQIAV